MKKKILGAVSILFFGGIVTVALLALTAFGLAMSGMSASSTGRNTTLWSVWPCPLYFLIVAGAPFIGAKKKRRTLLAASIGVLVLTSCAATGLTDGLVVAALILGVSIIVWVPLLGLLEYRGDDTNSRFAP